MRCTAAVPDNGGNDEMRFSACSMRIAIDVIASHRIASHRFLCCVYRNGTMTTQMLYGLWFFVSLFVRVTLVSSLQLILCVCVCVVLYDFAWKCALQVCDLWVGRYTSTVQSCLRSCLFFFSSICTCWCIRRGYNCHLRSKVNILWRWQRVMFAND